MQPQLQRFFCITSASVTDYFIVSVTLIVHSTLCTFGGSSWGKFMIRIQSCNDILIPTHISLCDGGAVKRGASKAKQHGIKSTQKQKVYVGCYLVKDLMRAELWGLEMKAKSF